MGTANKATTRDETQNGQQRNGESGTPDTERLANALGWFSIGLGLAEIAAPRRVARLIGVSDADRNRTLMRAFGLREIASGVGILSQERPAGWVWARVAGDAMDLAFLGTALSSNRTGRRKTAAATAAVLGVAALDVLCGARLTRSQEATTGGRATGGIRVKKSITVNRPVDEVYRFWRDFENLPRFMRHLESVKVTGERRSHWKAKAPAGMTVEWDAETTEDRPNELIAWRSIDGADVDNAGSVRFRPAPGGRGTEVIVAISYDPPGGVVTSKLAKLFREEPGQQVHDDLRAFKQVMETGEVVLSDATVRPGLRPARPLIKPATA